jgi:phytoene/squalene synthetase
MAGPDASFRAAVESAQAAAGIIAARHRGDLADADSLLEDMSDRQKAAGFLLLADLAIGLLARYEDRPIDELAADLSLQIAAHASRFRKG